MSASIPPGPQKYAPELPFGLFQAGVGQLFYPPLHSGALEGEPSNPKDLPSAQKPQWELESLGYLLNRGSYQPYAVMSYFVILYNPL